MAEDYRDEVRSQLLAALMEKVGQDRFPSTTMLDMIEELLTPDDVGDYAELLLEHIRSDQFPSIPMMDRLSKFA